MSPVESQNAITVAAVRAALKGLIFTSTPVSFSKLEELLLVGAFLKEHNFPATPQSRQYALGKVLLNLISERFTYLCHMCCWKAPLLTEPFDQALNRIEGYARTNAPALTAWCWMYYRYVRSELPIMRIEFSCICRIDERTLRRYHNQALTQLTTLLIEAEWQEIQRWR